MKKISEQLVEETWQEISCYNPEQIGIEFSKFGERQPDLMTFILEFTQNQKQKIIELCLYIFFVICRIYEKGMVTKIKQISYDEIEKVFIRNENLIESLEGAHEKFYERIAKVQLFNQPFVMKYMIEALIEETDEEYKLSENETGHLFFLLKTVIDIFDNELEK